MFTPTEKRVLMMRLEEDGANGAHDRLHIWHYLADWKIWLAYNLPRKLTLRLSYADHIRVLAYIGAEENASSVVAFQPAILKGIGYSSTAAQVDSIPVYIVAFVFSLTGAYISERLSQRYFFALLGVFCGVVGLAIEIAQPRHHVVRYLGMFFFASGR